MTRLAACLALAATTLLTPLAARADDPPGCRDFAQRWARAQTDPDTPTTVPLVLGAADNGCVALMRTMLDGGALLEAKDRFGNSALIHAARSGQLDVMLVLIERGADLKHRNAAGSDALFSAVERNQKATSAALLEHGADANAPGRSGATPLAAAAFNGNDDLVALLLQHGADAKAGDRTGKAPIVYAAARASVPVVQRLLATGIDVNARYENDLTILMWAAGHTDDAKPEDGVTLVTDLLARGAHVDDEDNRGRTALLIAAERGHTEIVRILLAHGADRTHRDKDGKSAADLTANTELRQTLAAQ
jgi:uncharacterized protein